VLPGIEDSGRTTMSESEKTASGTAADDATGPVPILQRILDNPFLLLFLGVTIPTVLYIVWGVMEIASVPIAE
jgi:hypothetical protein